MVAVSPDQSGHHEGVSMRGAYRFLSIFNMSRALFRGPAAFARNRIRAKAHKTLAREMRKAGL